MYENSSESEINSDDDIEDFSDFGFELVPFTKQNLELILEKKKSEELVKKLASVK